MGESRIPEGKKRVVITLDEDVIKLVDHVAAQVGSNRSKMMGVLIEAGLDEVGLAAAIGLTPKRVHRLKGKLVAMGLMAESESEKVKRARDRDMERIRKRLGYVPNKESEQ